MRTTNARTPYFYLLLAMVCLSAIYFYPFWSSSISWMRNTQFQYENRTPVKLPFRWISAEGAGLALLKPAASINSFAQDARFFLTDNGPDFNPNDQARSRLLRDLGIVTSQGAPNEPTYPLTSAGLLCSRIPLKAEKSYIVWVHCFSSNFRYSLSYMGPKPYIAEASQIAKQIVR